MAQYHRRKVLVTASALPLVLLASACQPATAPEKPLPAQPAQTGPATLFIAADIVQGSKNIPEDQRPLRSCVLSSRFPRNSEMVWRARVFDPRSGELMDNKVLSKVEVQISNGVNLSMRYGPHPANPPGEPYWTASWVVPKDHPTGTLRYSITAVAVDGRTGRFEPFSVSASLPAILDEVLPDLPAR